MTTLPPGMTRYTGANSFSAQDAEGKIFYIFQSGSGDFGKLVMVRDGVSTEIPVPIEGRPSLECNPAVGLWAIGNKESGPRATPPRYPIPEYTPFKTTGGLTLLASPATSPAWEGRTLNGGVWVDIPTIFHVPSSSAYLLRFVAQADTPNVRVRAGLENAPAFLTVNTQVANVQIHTQGWGPGPLCFISTVNGEARVWLQVLGWA